MRVEELSIYGETVKYSVKDSEKAERLRIAVYADGDVVVVRPRGTHITTLKKFVESKSDWIYKKLDSYKTNSIPELRKNSEGHFIENKKAAQDLVEQKVNYWNGKLGFKYDNVTIKQLKSRWGSCSSKNNLSFNYKIIFLPEELQDYVVVHELCHLKQLNHSPKFWNLIASVQPDYIDFKKKMRSI
ncbi:MAG: SprT family zinc-dependent metalloprotease [Candidatus Saccharimonadales bacterium]